MSDKERHMKELIAYRDKVIEMYDDCEALFRTLENDPLSDPYYLSYVSMRLHVIEREIAKVSYMISLVEALY